MTAAPPTRPIRLSRLSPSAETIELSPDANERAWLARELDLLAVPALEARLVLKAKGRDGAHIAGALKGEVDQQCIASLEPVRATLDIAFERHLMRQSGPARTMAVFEAGEMILDPLEDDTPDLVESDEIDLWPILLEELSLAINPFPRRPDFVLTDSAETAIDTPQEESQRPFANLKDRLAGRDPK